MGTLGTFNYNFWLIYHQPDQPTDPTYFVVMLVQTNNLFCVVLAIKNVHTLEVCGTLHKCKYLQ